MTAYEIHHISNTARLVAEANERWHSARAQAYAHAREEFPIGVAVRWVYATRPDGEKLWCEGTMFSHSERLTDPKCICLTWSTGKTHEVDYKCLALTAPGSSALTAHLLDQAGKRWYQEREEAFKHGELEFPPGTSVRWVHTIKSNRKLYRQGTVMDYSKYGSRKANVRLSTTNHIHEIECDRLEKCLSKSTEQAADEAIRPLHPKLTAAPAENHSQTAVPTYQARVSDWTAACFGDGDENGLNIRVHRFFEEATELVQSLGCSKNEVLQLVDYVYGRPTGEPKQEVGGVMVTLAALCHAAHMSMADCGECELTRVWENCDRVRSKQASKPRFQPL